MKVMREAYVESVCDPAADSDSMAFSAPACGARTVRIPTAPGGVSGVAGTSASNAWAIKGGRVYHGTR